VEGGLFKWSISVCGSSVRGTWRRDSCTVDPGYVKEGSGNGHYLPKLGNLEGESFTRDFESWMKEGSGNGASFSEGAL
jgi:hypothetical protein